MKLRDSLTRNWTLKLTSLTLAVVLWLVAAAEEPGTTTLPVRIAVQAPPGRTLLHPPAPISAIVTGPRGDLFRLASEQLVIIRTLPDTTTRQIELQIGPNDVDLPGGVDVRVHDVYPRRIALELDAVETRSVPVRPMLRVPSDSALALEGGISVEPAVVEVTGAREQVLALDTLYTLPVELDRGRSVQRVRIDTVGIGGLLVEPAIVAIHGNVATADERTFDSLGVHLPGGLADSLRVAEARVSVTVRGDAGRLSGLTRDSILVTVGHSVDSRGRAALRIAAPAGLNAIPLPDSITLVPRTR